MKNPTSIHQLADRLAGTCLLALVLAATAPESRAAEILPQDEVVLELTVEDWVETETARVVAVIDAAVADAEVANARDTLDSVLKDLAENGDWRTLNFQRNRDEAGLERWRLVAETRLPETSLGGLHERAQGASKPGRQVRIQTIDFSPRLQDREATRAALRDRIYQLAAEELKRLNAVYPARDFRIGRIDFGSDGMLPPAPMPVMAEGRQHMVRQDMAKAEGGGMAVSERMVLAARVALVAVAPGQ